MSNDKIDLADFNELLSLQTAPTAQKGTPEPTPKELAQQRTIMKVYRKYQQREYERIEHPNQFPTDYFFSALAELLLDMLTKTTNGIMVALTKQGQTITKNFMPWNV